MEHAFISATLLSAAARAQPPAPEVDAASAFLLHLALLRSGYHRPAATAAAAALSPREREVALLLAQGFAALNVAARLGVSEHTVRTYTRRIYRKLNVVSRIELARAL